MLEEKTYSEQLDDFLEQFKDLKISIEAAAKQYGETMPEWFQKIDGKIEAIAILGEKVRAEDFEQLPELIRIHETKVQEYNELKEKIDKFVLGYPFSSSSAELMGMQSKLGTLGREINSLQSQIEPMLEAMKSAISNANADANRFKELVPQTKPTQNPESQGNFSIFESEPNSTPVPQPNNDLQFMPSSKPIASQEIDSSEEQTVSQPEPIKEPLKVQQDQPIQIKSSQELNTFEEQSLDFHEQIIDLLTENNTLLTQTNTLLESDSSGTGSSSSNDDTASDIMPTSAPLLDAQAFAPTIGQAHDGIDSVPREGTWLLDKGERVLDARTNQDLKSFLANDDDEELDAQGATQELRDFKAATTEAEQAATDFDDTMNGMQVQMLDLEDICQKTLGNVTQQMRDFGAAATDAGQAVSGLEPAMNGIQEQMQGLEEIFQKTLNGRAIFESRIGHDKTHQKSYYVLAA